MLKQFNPELLSFRDPTTKEDGWFDVATQDDINAIFIEYYKWWLCLDRK